MKTEITAAFLMVGLAGCAGGGLSSATASLEPSPYAATNEPDKPIAGIVGGGLISGTIGAGLSRSARHQALEAEYKALETASAGQPVNWAGGGARGQVIAAQPYRVGSQNCRQYAQTVTGATQRMARGTACRNADGSWTVLN
jgi:surface antigen